jgi:inorganic pyrophosphatase
MYDNLHIGKNAPKEVNILTEIPMNSGPVKYEFNKECEIMEVDRFLRTPMQYPVNYGFIPHTLSEDGDPLDALVYTTHPLAMKTLISAKPIGVLMTEDEKGKDEKILLVPANNVDSHFKEVNCFSHLPKAIIDSIEHFFSRYKDLEPGKWVKVSGWGDAAAAHNIIDKAIARCQKEEI